jgi:hypothetical protein
MVKTSIVEEDRKDAMNSRSHLPENFGAVLALQVVKLVRTATKSCYLSFSDIQSGVFASQLQT